MRHAHISPFPGPRRPRTAAAFIALSLVITVIATNASAHDQSTAVHAGGLDGGTTQGPASSTGKPEASSTADPSGEVVYRVDTDEPVVFVTIDDGHHPSREALDIVRAHDIPVSLFLYEDPVVHNHSYFTEYISLGNYVHSHTLTHTDLTQLEPAEQKLQICGMVDVLDQRYGHTDGVGSLLRAPYGASNETTAAAAQRCGLDTIVHWSATAERGQISFAAGTELQPGDIILTHFTEDLPENLTRIRELANDAGLTFTRLEDHL